MKKINPLFIALFFLLIFQSNAWAQRPAGSYGGPAGDVLTGSIKGKVIEKDSKTPVEYANVALYNKKDSSLVTGAITKDDGTFVLNDVKYGPYYLEVHFIGFDKDIISNLRLSPDTRNVDVGSISLSPASQQLQEVEVTAEKPRVDYQIDKKIINVGKDLNSAGATAVEALENTPGINVDIDGNVSLRGDSNFKVYIDGKPSILEGSDALQQIPANSIDHIEVITNPSAKYDPDGMSGIINIILKKNVLKGLSGLATVSVGLRDKYQANLELGYRTKKFNFYTSLDWNDQTFFGNRTRYLKNGLSDTTSFLSSEGERNFNRSGNNFKGGFDYFLSDRTTLTLEGGIGNFGFNHDGLVKNYEFTMPATTETRTITDDSSPRKYNFYSLNLNLKHEFDDKGHELTGFINYSDRSGGSNAIQTTYNADSSWNIIDNSPAKVNTVDNADGGELRVQTDYTKPFGQDQKFEAGYQLRYEKYHQDFLFQNFDYETNDWLTNEEYSSALDYSQQIQSMYAMFSGKWNKFGYQAGLRSEYTDRNIQDVKSDEPYKYENFNFFPTLHLSKSFPHNHELMASYTRRINRPRSWDLDPFPSYEDQYNIRMGNPNLKPEFVDAYELNYQKTFGVSFVSMEAYYRTTHDMITRIHTLRDDGVLIHTSDNLNNDYSMGVEAMLNFEITKWFNLNASAELYHYELKGAINNENVDRQSNNYNFKFNPTFNLPKDFRIQIDGMYNGPSVSTQGDRESFYVVSAALRKDFMKKKLSATLNIRDIFGTMKYAMNQYASNFEERFEFTREPRVVTLSISYKINNFKKNSRDKNGDNGGGGPDMDMQ